MTPTQAKLRDWIAGTAGIDPSAIALDTRLVKERILTSLMVLDLILFIEELRGGPLDPAAIAPASFQTIDAIAAAFLPEVSHG